MGNIVGNSYGLTVLIPIKAGEHQNTSYSKIVRNTLQTWPLHDRSPMAKIPNTYLCRFYLLSDVFYEGAPAEEEHLQSEYLVFSSNFHGDLETYLAGMWDNAAADLKEILQHCVAFDAGFNTDDFIAYIKKCQIKNSLFFNGSNDKPLAEQLKALYIKQSFSHFVYLTQHMRFDGEAGAQKLQDAFKRYVDFVQLSNLNGPSWPLAATEIPSTLEKDIKALV